MQGLGHRQGCSRSLLPGHGVGAARGRPQNLRESRNSSFGEKANEKNLSSQMFLKSVHMDGVHGVLLCYIIAMPSFQ